MPLFSVVADKLDRISRELDRLEDYLAQSNEAGAANTWSRTATIAFTLHGAYTGIEDVLSDVARTIDGSVPHGDRSHQALLEQKRAPIEGIRPALLDDALYLALLDLKGFRHLVRHHYGVDLIPSRTEANRQLMVRAFALLRQAVTDLENDLSSPA